MATRPKNRPDKHRRDDAGAKSEEAAKLGTYRVDYSEPTQEEIDAANASWADTFKTGNWVPVNRKP
jgi:hypothetical protein